MDISQSIDGYLTKYKKKIIELALYLLVFVCAANGSEILVRLRVVWPLMFCMRGASARGHCTMMHMCGGFQFSYA